jgi:hypothetical protein
VMLIMSAMALMSGVADGSAASAATWRRICTGMGLTRLGGGSAREYPRNCR